MRVHARVSILLSAFPGLHLQLRLYLSLLRRLLFPAQSLYVAVARTSSAFRSVRLSSTVRTADGLTSSHNSKSSAAGGGAFCSHRSSKSPSNIPMAGATRPRLLVLCRSPNQRQPSGSRSNKGTNAHMTEEGPPDERDLAAALPWGSCVCARPPLMVVVSNTQLATAYDMRAIVFGFLSFIFWRFVCKTRRV